jgi:iron(III) transport system ATP-binding protein
MVVTHDAEEAMRMADRIALLREGRLVQVGSAQELFLTPANLFVAGFFSELNVFETIAENGIAATPLGHVPADLPSGTAVSAAVRIGTIDVSEKSGDTPARLTSRRFLGDHELAEFAVPNSETPVKAKIARGVLSPKAREVFLTIRKSDVLVFESAAANV